MQSEIQVWSEENSPYGGACSVLDELIFGICKQKHKLVVVTNKKLLTKVPTSCDYQLKFVNPKLGPISFICYGYLSTKSADYLILNDVRAIYSFGVLSILGIKIATNVVINLHGSEIQRFVAKVTWKRRLLFYPFFVKHALKRADKINCVSKFLKNSVSFQLSKFKWFNSRRVDVCYAGVKQFLIDRMPLSDEINKHIANAKSKKKFLLVSAGRLDPEKGYISMIDILNNSNHRNVSWLILGATDHRSEKIIEKLQTVKFEYFLAGGVPRNMLPSVYKECDLFWLLSTYEEGFGMAWYEALNCDLRVIGRPRGALPEFISNENGLLSECNEEIKRYLNRAFKAKNTNKPFDKKVPNSKIEDWFRL